MTDQSPWAQAMSASLFLGVFTQSPVLTDSEDPGSLLFFPSFIPSTSKSCAKHYGSKTHKQCP